MVYKGHFENGVIVLDEEAKVPDGVQVRVELLPPGEAQAVPVTEAGTHYEHYQSIVGAIDDLPADFAAQHDHYIHGTPKK